MSEIALYAYNKHFTGSEAGVNSYSGISVPYEYRLWDADHNSACACDVGYLGVDCSLRDCPYGDDPLTNTPASCGADTCKSEVQSFSVDGSQDTPGTYYLTFTDYTGVSFTTTEFPLYTDSTVADWATKKLMNEEVVQARRLYERQGWPVIDVTRRSVEETAAAVLNLLQDNRPATAMVP